VKFNFAACMIALEQHLLATLKLMQAEYLVDAKSHMRTPEGADSLHEGDIQLLAGWLAVTVAGGAYAAMDEFGTGSLMDKSNPALPGYMKSGLWNPARGEDPTIRSRSPGPYTNIFGEEVVSHAARPGYNLEQKGGKYAPQPPSHALQTAAKWMVSTRAIVIWQRALKAFPWGSFIVATVD